MGVEEDVYRLLERRRKELGLTQAEVTKRAFGKAEDTSLLQNIRRSTKRGPSLRNLAAACDALGLKLEIVPREPNGSALPAATADLAEEPTACAQDRRRDAIELARIVADLQGQHTRIIAELQELQRGMDPCQREEGR